MSSWEQIKQIKGLLASLVAGFSVVSVIGLALMDWRVAVHVRAEMAKQDLGTDTKIVAMDATAAENKRTGEENAKDIDDLDARVLLAFQALIAGPPE